MLSSQLPHLETFILAAEAASFTAAARQLDLSQGAVSLRMQQLETELKTTLFTRRGGRVELTTHGLQLHDLARRILALHDQARAVVKGQPPAPSGELTLAASSVPGEHLLPRILSGFRRRYPWIRTEVRIDDSRVVLQCVKKGHAQVGLVGTLPQDAELIHARFASDQLVLVVPRSARWRGRRQISVAEFLQQPLLLRETGSGSRACLEAALASAGMCRHSGPNDLVLGSNEAILQAVERGLGVAVLSKLAVARQLRAGQVKQLSLADLSLRRDLYIVRHKKRALAPAARHFWTHLVPAESPH